MHASTTVELTQLNPDDAIILAKDSWCSLYDNTPPNFFLSWSWIGSWLSTIPPASQLFLCRCHLSGELRAMFFFVVKRETLLGLPHYVAHVNRCGEQDNDQIWIENNDILTTHNECFSAAILAVLKHTRANEISVNVAKEALYTKASFALHNSDLLLDFESVETGRYSEIASGYTKNYSKSLKRNLAQSYKFATQNHLSFSIDAVFTTNEILENLLNFSKWHIAKWAGTSTPSGFINDAFVQFHKALISNNHNTPENRPVLLLLKQNGVVVGINYGFQCGKWFGFYLSSISPSISNQLRLGLVMHDLSMQYLKEQGVATYDFMAGDARYKEQFCSNKEIYGNLSIKNNLIRFRVKFFLLKVRDVVSHLLWQKKEMLHAIFSKLKYAITKQKTN